MKEFFKYTLATIVGIAIVSFIGFFMFFIIIGAIISSTEKEVSVSENTLLMLSLSNQIVERAPYDPFQDLDFMGFSMIGNTGLDDILSSINKAKNDERIKGIYLNLYDINGGMATLEEIRNALISFKDESGKPIYAYGDYYSQKAYYLASVADNIALHPQGAIDFRGLGGEAIFYKNALDKIGVEVQIIRHGTYKAAVEPYMLEEMSPENREQTMAYLKSIWAHMLKGISEERNISVEKLNVLANDVLTYRSSNIPLENGMVDFLKYKDEVLDDLREIAGIETNKEIPVISPTDYANVYVAPPENERKRISRNKIAVLYASGNIGIPLSSEIISGDDFSREIRKARIDSSYKAIVLRINSPGGDAFASEEIWREVKLAADEKVVVVSMSDYAASGGYYIACAADKIIAHPNTITGSIGVFGTIPNAGELLNDKLGITFDVVKTNEHSDMISFTRGFTDFEETLMQNYVDDFYDTFLTRVSEGRGMEKTAVDKIGEGRVWTGEMAKEIGLVDELGGINDAIEMAAEMAGLEDYRTVSLPTLLTPWEELLSMGPEKIKTWFIEKELGENAKFYKLIKNIQDFKGVQARIPYEISIQ